GAYCFTMASNYNSRYRPAEILWYNGKPHLIRARESFEDIVRNQVDHPSLFQPQQDKVIAK
ncbi:MAG: diaminopimelate decarboxylase, partial [Flavobacteriaceae bacterium]|nr:diaminopimelate decarboxylase [Muriicola sp.]NNL38317.1 diaminopimelate decarboxylase [Flavobacteriaceae bacterium]